MAVCLLLNASSILAKPDDGLIYDQSGNLSIVDGRLMLAFCGNKEVLYQLSDVDGGTAVVRALEWVKKLKPPVTAIFSGDVFAGENPPRISVNGFSFLGGNASCHLQDVLERMTQTFDRVLEAEKRGDAPWKLNKSQIRVLGQKFNVDKNGFVALNDFSMPLLGLDADDAASFFDRRSRFYDHYQILRQDIRHNIKFIRHIRAKEESLPDEKMSSRVYYQAVGGIHKDDLVFFILKAQQEIDANSKRLKSL